MNDTFSPSQNYIIKNVQAQKHFKNLINNCPTKILTIAKNSLESCIHLVQDEFGSGFCVDSRGFFVTCYHCVEKKKNCTIIFPSGEISEAVVAYKDKSLDLALLKIENSKRTYMYLNVATETAEKGTKIFCIGNPCNEDLEHEKKGIKTNYLPFFISFGKVQDYTKDRIYGKVKSGLGPLIHSCWTYWGHSGAPILNYDGKVVGVHNSWDDKNGNRHGLSVETIIEFMNKAKKYIKN